MPGDDELYVVARRVLLDALDALGPHRDAVVLVGAHAIYLRVGEADLAVAAFTTDGDLVLDPAALAELPPLELGLTQAGFVPETSGSVGVWVTSRTLSDDRVAQVAIDLLVPEAVAPAKGRRARLQGHHDRAARTVRGLEGALVDADPLRLTSLEPADARAFEIQVAGVAALLISKLHKINDRQGSQRLNDKDALDILRLLRGVSTDELAGRYRRLLADPRSAGTARRGIELLSDQLGNDGAVGATMIRRAAGLLSDPAELVGSAIALTQDLLDSLSGERLS